MSLLSKLTGRVRQDSFVFEAVCECNCACGHCYNVWRGPGEYPTGRLDTAETLAMLDEMIRQTGARLVTLSGGEPLLRPDIFEIVNHLVARRRTVNFLSNGLLLDESAIARLTPEKISIFELPLLSCEREIHDAMVGVPGAFDKVTLAIARLKAAGQRVVTVFVATKRNLATWRRAAEIAVALGADGIMFNRFNPGGAGIANLDALQSDPDTLAAALDVAVEIHREYGLSISCSIAMPPCLFDHSRWPELGFGFCAAGGPNAYYTLDPVGNVRPCNHSPRILGNIHTDTFASMARSESMRQFMDARPAFCAGCAKELECQGGCKAAAEVCAGDVTASDPFLAAYEHQAQKL